MAGGFLIKAVFSGQPISPLVIVVNQTSNPPSENEGASVNLQARSAVEDPPPTPSVSSQAPSAHSQQLHQFSPPAVVGLNVTVRSPPDVSSRSTVPLPSTPSAIEPPNNPIRSRESSESPSDTETLLPVPLSELSSSAFNRYASTPRQRS
eukprot:7470404-Pyramimonas_sp.AAC.1